MVVGCGGVGGGVGLALGVNRVRTRRSSLYHGDIVGHGGGRLVNWMDWKNRCFGCC